LGIFLQTVINGIMLGSIYALVALGLTLIYGILEIPNFAHGALYMVGAYISFLIITSLGIPYWFALILSAAFLFFVGMFVERVVYRPLYVQPVINSFIAAVGLILILENGALALWGPQFRRFPRAATQVFQVLGVTITSQRILVIVLTVLLILAVHWFIKRTRWGAAIEATSQNRQGAQLMGINVSRVGGITFGLGTAMAAVAASLVAPILMIYPTMGGPVIGMAFVIIILGGMGSFFGAVVGGYLIGLAETLFSTYVTTNYVEALIFGILVVVLAVKPTGLFGKAH
jgi:branched-chain amino acid transport system permease protein